MNNRLAKLLQSVMCTLCLFASLTSHAQQKITPLNIAVAANFLPAFRDIQVRYEAQSNSRLIASTGSTGQLYHQIYFGAPFDIFLSADTATNRRLISEAKASPESFFVYATGRLVLWSRKRYLPLDSGKILHHFDKQLRLAIANPKTSPYGKATLEVLRHNRSAEQWIEHLVTGQNITQVFQFVESQNVDMGFISLAQLRIVQTQENHNPNYWLVPQSLHQPIKQSAVILSSSQKVDQAKQFLNFLKSPEVIKILQNYGYE